MLQDDTVFILHKAISFSPLLKIFSHLIYPDCSFLSLYFSKFLPTSPPNAVPSPFYLSLENEQASKGRYKIKNNNIKQKLTCWNRIKPTNRRKRPHENAKEIDPLLCTLRILIKTS